MTEWKAWIAMVIAILGNQTYRRTCMLVGLSDSARHQFDEKGFLIIEEALTTKEVRLLIETVDDIYEQLGGEPETGRLEVRNCVAQHPMLLEMISRRDVLALVVDLLGGNIKIRSSHLDVRPPVGEDVASRELGKERCGEPEQWHTDGPIYGYPLVNGMMPMMEIKVGYYLTDVANANAGPLCVVPGSHKLDYRMLALESFNIPNEVVYRVNVAAGSAIIFRNGIWHCVSPNISTATRKVLYYAYTYRWIHPSDYLVQSEELISTCTPVQRQLLGATTSEQRSPLGGDWMKTPCSFLWYSEVTDVPLIAWWDSLRRS
jgi:ectoine hydroxylase